MGEGKEIVLELRIQNAFICGKSEIAENATKSLIGRQILREPAHISV